MSSFLTRLAARAGAVGVIRPRVASLFEPTEPTEPDAVGATTQDDSAWDSATGRDTATGWERASDWDSSAQAWSATAADGSQHDLPGSGGLFGAALVAPPGLVAQRGITTPGRRSISSIRSTPFVPDGAEPVRHALESGVAGSSPTGADNTRPGFAVMDPLTASSDPVGRAFASPVGAGASAGTQAEIGAEASSDDVDGASVRVSRPQGDLVSAAADVTAGTGRFPHRRPSAVTSSSHRAPIADQPAGPIADQPAGPIADQPAGPDTDQGSGHEQVGPRASGSRLPFVQARARSQRLRPSQAPPALAAMVDRDTPPLLAEPVLEAPRVRSVRPGVGPDPEPVVQVTIGRVEIRAVLPNAPAPAAGERGRGRTPAVSLEDYLRSRGSQ